MDIFQNSCSIGYQADCVIKIVEKYQWRSSTLIGTGHLYRLILIGLAMIENSYFVEDLPVAASKWVKIDILFNIIIKERCEIKSVK